ncbi:unnamed protein product [Prorocentrum cordatum]|uniref:Uncharacterized protein n=1 Tax=Prorocentrum cordatum TaxID=2364126 RepID=A0ABN9V2D3_9DINO|nr:unnamed protein product [Polarella glacialis]
MWEKPPGVAAADGEASHELASGRPRGGRTAPSSRLPPRTAPARGSPLPDGAPPARGDEPARACRVPPSWPDSGRAEPAGIAPAPTPCCQRCARATG